MVATIGLYYHPELANYRFGPGHPLSPVRLETSLDLWNATGLLTPTDLLTCPPATGAELELFHRPDYLAAVARSAAGPSPDLLAYGLGTPDNPVYPGQGAAAAYVVGGTLGAARDLAGGRIRHALAIGGGLHHARPAAASGFCLYNDLAVAIRFLRREGLRVGYIDIDAHHGDGILAAFATDPAVLAISLHETGRTLFPGTGEAPETGSGYTVNIPLEPGTADDSYLEAFRQIALPAVRRFRPDILVSQCGTDAHYWDPLSHLALSTQGYATLFRDLHDLAHDAAAGRWLATGGGGYDPYRVVPRVWGRLWAEMAERALSATLPEAWRVRWAERSPFVLPESWDDPPFPMSAASPEATIANRRTLATLRAIRRPF